MSRRRRRAREKQLRHAFAEAASRPRTLAAGSGLAIAATLVSGSVAHAASTFEVDTTADTTDSMCSVVDDDCSLRGAIAAAEADPGSTITFASDVTGTITLTSALPDLTAGESIQGPGAKALTIDQNDVFRAMGVQSASPVTIAGLTITNGNDIALFQKSGSGQLSLSNIALELNDIQTIGVDSEAGGLVVNGSTISGGNLGIWTQAGLTMDNSTISGNANAGVRIAGTGSATIENSTISANYTGIEVYAGQLNLNSTIVAGSNRDDVRFSDGTTLAESFSLIQDTTSAPTPETGSTGNLDGQDPQLGALADHGGQTKTMLPSISSPVVDKGKDYTTTGVDQRGFAIVDNPDTDVPNAADARDIGAAELRARPSVSSLSPASGHAGDTVTITGTGFTGATAVKFGSVDATSFTVVSPTEITATAPPGHNGAVDVTVTRDTTSATSAADQFTYPTFNVDTTSDSGALSACTPAAGDCSLRGAINGANQSAGSTITFAPSVTGSVTLASDLPVLLAGETVEGPGADVLAIDGADQFRGLRAATGPAAVDISGLTVTRSDYGVYSTGGHLLTLTKMAVSNSKPGVHGIRADSDLAINGSTISGNDGLGVKATAGLTMNNSTVTGNGQGGVYVGDSGTIDNSTISTNGGVGIYTYSGAINLDSTIVAGNTGSDVSIASGHGATVTENFSLIQDETGLPALEAGSGDNVNGQDPLLGALADNGGPTKTMKPSSTSPVLDNGKDYAGTGLDQRGIALTDLSAIANAADGRDIGAVELALPQVTAVTSHVQTAQIGGQGFTGATAVKFGGTDATSFTVDDDGQITAVVPPGSGTVDVTVTGPDGTSTTSAADEFTYPTTFDVDTTSDSAGLSNCTPTPDDCNLRGAITAANGAPGSTITFASGVTGTITLGSDLPTMSAGEKLHGPGPGVLTIDANQHYGLRVGTSYVAVEMSGLTVTNANGYYGGAIYSEGNLPLGLSNMNVSGNTAQYGSGIYANSPLTVDGSTISGNNNNVSGAPAVLVRRALTMTNSTVSGNAAGTGGVESGGGTIENSTIAGNGGTGLVVPRNVTVNLQSSIVAGNTGSDVEVGTGTAKLSENFSLIQNLGSVTPDPGTSANNVNGVDPQLGALTDNGGSTKTMKPSGSSPVIDKGKDFTGTGVDQRGAQLTDVAGIDNAADGRDIGAVELAFPAVTSVSPASANAGDTITITGANFTGATGVKFGSADATDIQVVDATHITAKAPAGSGTVDVSVVAPDGTSSNTAADNFHYLAPPTVGSLSPDHGNAGETVTITGTNLTGATGVKFGSADATDVTVVDATHVTAKAPAGSGTVDVRVTTPDGTSANGAADDFTYDAAPPAQPPTVSSLSPTGGSAGTTVTITGTNLTGTTGVKFGSADATDVSFVDATHVTAKAPAGTGTVDVRVTTPGGTSADTASDNFTYVAAPTGLTDPQVLKLLKRGALSATFVPKKKTLVFKDRLPEAGKATYTLKVARKRKQLSLGKATSVTATKAGTVKVTIKLGKKGWTTLRHNPKGKLALLTTFKRKLNSHSLKTTRTIKPKRRPKH